MSDPYVDGANAFDAGGLLSHNPYEYPSAEWEAWEAGFIAAEQDSGWSEEEEV